MKKVISPETTMAVGFIMAVLGKVLGGAIGNFTYLGGLVVLVIGFVSWRRAKKRI